MTTSNPKFDNLCLQEHKFRGDKANIISKRQWKLDPFWSLEASLGDEVDDIIRIGIRKGGVAMCFHPKL